MRKSSRGNPWHDAEGKFCSCAEAEQLKIGEDFIDVRDLSVEEKKKLKEEVESDTENIAFYQKQAETREFLCSFFGKANAEKELSAYGKMSEEDKKAYQKCVENEPEITKTLDFMCNLAGKEFRLKSPSSIVGKQARKKKTVDSFWDIVRYTHISDEESLAGETKSILTELESQGHMVCEFKNTWGEKNSPYRGINVKLSAPNGQKYELQFHTKESFELKNGELHSLYEISRKIDEKKRLTKSDKQYKSMLGNMMIELSEKLKIPAGADKLEWKK